MNLRWAHFLVAMLAVAASVSFAADATLRGKAIFESHCAICHGLNGDGQGPEARRFFTQPADLREGSFKFRSTLSGSLPTDQDLERTIRYGLPGSGMIAQDHLSEEELRAVIVYLKTLSPRWTKEPAPNPIKIIRPTDLSSLVEKGKGLFKKAGCPECHGERGRGDGPSAQRLTSRGRPTRPPDLTRRPLKGGDRPEDIYRALAAGIDGTPMPSYRDALEEEEIWALALYVTRLAAAGAPPSLTDDERIGREVEERHQPGRRR